LAETSLADRYGTRSFGDKMGGAGNRSSGFDYLRVALALSVVSWHSLVTSYGTELQSRVLAGPWRSIVAVILPMFFALSGFLVAGSLQRNALPTFLGLRALRIMPALAIEVMLSALLLGPLVTDGSLTNYFQDVRFSNYFLNIIGNIHYFLPGVFAGNPFPFYVNAQLWTIPFELQCYVLLAVSGMAGACRYPQLLAVTTIGLQGACGGLAWLTGHDDGGLGSTVPGYVLTLCFLAGVTLYLMRDRVSYNFLLLTISIVLIGLALQLPYGDFLIPFPVAYGTVFLGLANPRRWFLVRWGDYSYGIFLYGFPIQQLVASQGAAFHSWYINLLIAVPLVVAFAAVSWVIVERPALSLRRHVISVGATAGAVVERSATALRVQAARLW
jgi:peptidoglycan/LPS O-acetylase OafA/YrhL